MVKGELVDREKAEDAVKEEVKKRVKREVTGIDIEYQQNLLLWVIFRFMKSKVLLQ